MYISTKRQKRSLSRNFSAQGYRKWGLGLAVYVPKEYIADRKEDDLNYLYVVKPDKNKSIHYYVSFCADKEEKGYHSAKEWFASMDGWKGSVSHPVSVRVK